MTESSSLGWAAWARNIRQNSKFSAKQLAEKSENDKESKPSIPILRAREESRHLMLSVLDLRLYFILNYQHLFSLKLKK